MVLSLDIKTFTFQTKWTVNVAKSFILKTRISNVWNVDFNVTISLIAGLGCEDIL